MIRLETSHYSVHGSAGRAIASYKFWWAEKWLVFAGRVLPKPVHLQVCLSLTPWGLLSSLEVRHGTGVLGRNDVTYVNDCV